LTPQPTFEDTVRSTLLTILLPVLLLFSLAGAAPGLPQRTGPPLLPGDRGNAGEDNPAQREIAHNMAKKANQDREKTIKSDTDKLVKLSAELKEYVEKSNENVLSLEVVKKAEEIEKLAHSVKEKMKGPN
jgi:hypothetical protein